MFVNKLGAKFPLSQVRSGGNVHSVVSVLSDIIWSLDNQMESFFNLAGGVNCVPKFIYQLGQPDNADGLGN